MRFTNQKRPVSFPQKKYGTAALKFLMAFIFQRQSVQPGALALNKS
jgi:hypothetical protein